MVIGHADPRSPPGSPDNLSLPHKTSIGLAILLVILLMPLTTIGGGGGTPQQFGCVFDTVTMRGCQTASVSIPVLDQAIEGTTSVFTYPKGSFGITPTISLSPLTNSSVNPPFSYLSVTTIQLSFLALPFNNPGVWTGATDQTEPYGFMELFVNNNQALQTWRWTVLCAVSASVTGEYLKVQYSIDSGGSWNDLSTSSSSHIIIDSTGCGLGISNGGSFLDLPSGFKVTNPSGAMIRVLDVGGSGLASDAPAFFNINVEFTRTIAAYTVIALVATSSQLQLGVIMATPVNNNVNIVVRWAAIA